MSLFRFTHIPNELLHASAFDEDINILIGENGSGKSTLLAKLAKHYLRENLNVIAIANTIYDKFNSNGNKLKILRASSGKSLARNTIVDALKNLASDDLKRLRSIGNTLEYIGFDPTISFRLKGVRYDFRDVILNANLPKEDIENLMYYLNRHIDRNFQNDNIADINFYTETFSDIKNSFLLTMFLYEKQLKRLKIISGINLYLHKNNNHIALNTASSGELTLVSSLIYLTTVITENSIILIDEPENSLHPKWQVEYVKRLSELFYFYQPKIVIGTHAPLILNGAELNSKKIKVFKGKNGDFFLHENQTTNVEEIFEDYFDITTPENRYLSDYIVDKMNLLTSKKIDISQFEKIVNDLKNNSYDEKQKRVLDGIIQMANEISNDIK